MEGDRESFPSQYWKTVKINSYDVKVFFCAINFSLAKSIKR